MTNQITSKITLTENQRIVLNELLCALIDSKHLTDEQNITVTSLKNQLNQYELPEVNNLNQAPVDQN